MKKEIGTFFRNGKRVKKLATTSELPPLELLKRVQFFKSKTTKKKFKSQTLSEQKHGFLIQLKSESIFVIKYIT